MMKFKSTELLFKVLVISLILIIVAACNTFNGEEVVKSKFVFPKEINGMTTIDQFYSDLQLGSFFHNESQFDFLVTDSSIYFITTNHEILDKQIMIHFLHEDRSFINKSFFFKQREIIDISCRMRNNIKFEVAKVHFPIAMSVGKVRIGQFDENGNIWYKILDIPEIRSNRLLKYNNFYEDCLKASSN